MVVAVNLLAGNPAEVCEFHFFTGLAAELNHFLSHSACTVGKSLESVEVGNVGCNSSVENALGEFYKVFVLGYEVSLAVERNYVSLLAIGRFGAKYATFLSFTVGALACHFLTFFAENIYCGIVIAIALGECLLAVHHTCAGKIAEFLNVACFNFSHFLIKRINVNNI